MTNNDDERKILINRRLRINRKFNKVEDVYKNIEETVLKHKLLYFNVTLGISKQRYWILILYIITSIITSLSYIKYEPQLKDLLVIFLPLIFYTIY